jgi:hypothetical protein
MSQPSPNDIVDIILNRREVFGLDTDSRIRAASNCLTARAFFEVLTRVNMDAPDVASVLSEVFSAHASEPLGMIAFDTVGTTKGARTDMEPQTGTAHECWLKLVFANEQAAYYQFPLFPDLDADYVLGATRKRTGAVQHIQLTLSNPEALQTFVESCQENPQLLRVEKSTAEEFDRSPSNAI